MKFLSSALFVLCLILAINAMAQDARFFSALPDVPIAPGLTELTDQGVSFDKPEGRIVESVALIQSGGENDLRAFYDNALPQLGWRKASALSFTREHESLRLTFESAKDQKFMRFSVTPEGLTAH